MDPKKFRAYAHMSKSRFRGRFIDTPYVQVSEKDPDSLEKVIFAPNPITGVPTSDVAVILANDSNPAVSQYIRDNLMRPIQGEPGTDDADLALASVKSDTESVEEYAERLKSEVNKTE